jgi:hypothetical protein
VTTETERPGEPSALLCFAPEPRTGCKWFAPSKDDREKCRHAGARPDGFAGFFCTCEPAVSEALAEITGRDE